MKKGRKQALTIALVIWVILLIATFYYLYDIYSGINESIPTSEVYTHQTIDANGEAFTMNKGDIVSINIQKHDYSFKVYDIGSDVKFVVNNFLYFDIDPMNTKKIDLDGNGYYDVEINVASISGDSATLSFSSISEKQTFGGGVGEAVDRFEGNSRLQTSILMLVILIVLLIILFIVIKYYIMPKVEEKRKQARKSEVETFFDFYYKFEEYKAKGNMTKTKKLYKKIAHLYRYMSESDKKKVKSKVDKMIKYLK